VRSETQFWIGLLLSRIAFAVFCLGCSGYAALWIGRRQRIEPVWDWVTLSAVMFLTGGLFNFWLARGFFEPPWMDLPGALLLLAWVAPMASLLPWRPIGARPQVFMASGISAVSIAVGLSRFSLPLNGPPPLLKSFWLLVHVPSGVAALAFCLLGAVASFLFLIKDRVKSN